MSDSVSVFLNTNGRGTEWSEVQATTSADIVNSQPGLLALLLHVQQGPVEGAIHYDVTPFTPSEGYPACAHLERSPATAVGGKHVNLIRGKHGRASRGVHHQARGSLRAAGGIGGAAV